MDFQLVAIRVEKVKRIAFAAVVFPGDHAMFLSVQDEVRKVLLLNPKSVMGVVARRSGRAVAGGVQRQAEPEISDAEICPRIPLCVARACQHIPIKLHAALQVANGQGEVVESCQHTKPAQ
ncbi:hypothetical protein D3C78_26180 [compost metagenome]